MSIERNKINALSDKIRAALEFTEAPYNPEQAVIDLGGVIQYDITETDFEAYIEKVSGTGFCIHLKPSENVKRERFTIAHELGHLFLHMGYLIDPEKWEKADSLKESAFYRDNRYSSEEFQANEFAAAFLMPKAEFINVANRYLQGNKYDTDAIAEHFKVSRKAASNRGKWLGIFQW